MNYHIDSLKIHAFRQIRQLEFRDFRRINLLVGVNNSGKTSVLEAIGVHCRPLDPMAWIAIARQREVNSSRESVLDSLRWLFPQDNSLHINPYYEGTVRIEGTGAFPCLETQAYFKGVYAHTLDDDQVASNDLDEEDQESSGSSSGAMSEGTEEFGAEIRLAARISAIGRLNFPGEDIDVVEERFEVWEGERFVSHAAPSIIALPVANISPFAHRVRRRQVSKLTELSFIGRSFEVVELLKLIDPAIEGIEILSRTGLRPTLYIRHQRTGYTPLSAVGDGLRRVISIALSLSTLRNGVLLIDEIETAIHKDALTKVFQWLVQACERLNVQLFATTHSLEAIDAMLNAQIDAPGELVAYHLPSCGEAPLKRFDGDILENIRFERGLDIR